MPCIAYEKSRSDSNVNIDLWVWKLERLRARVLEFPVSQKRRLLFDEGAKRISSALPRREAAAT